MLEKQKQKEAKDICPSCRGEINTLIVVKKQRLYKINNCWEAINDTSLDFYCPHCYSEIDVSKLKTKKVVF